MRNFERTYVKVNLDNIKFNMDSMKKNIDPQSKMVGVIKANGYGHGACEIGKMLETLDYVWGFAVATNDEALMLRNAGLKKDILVLGATFPEAMVDMINNNVRMNIYSTEVAKLVSETATKLGKKAIGHIKIDTGMSRLGFQATEESINEIINISKLPNLELEGMFTHYARMDEKDKKYAEAQFEKYMFMKNGLEKKGLTFKIYHTANSAAIVDCKKASFNMVRPGITLYGVYPSDETQNNLVPVKEALSWYAKVTFVKTLPAGRQIGYGGTFTTTRETKVATIPVGYADGYSRDLSNKGYVLIHGKKAPILGRICMDQFMVDVTDIPDVKMFDTVTLVGKDGDEEISVYTICKIMNKLAHEFMCDINSRVPRVYIWEGKEISSRDYLDWKF